MTVDPARGLTRDQVEASRREHGANVLTPPPRDSWLKQYLDKFNDPVIRILMIAAGVAIGVGAVDGHVAEGVGILVAIFLATFLAFWNEFRANKEFDVLNKSNDDVPVKVVRDGIYTTVPRRDIVVGDRVQVEVGEELPADGRLVEAVSLLVNEAKLTGESRPVEKKPDADAAMLRGTTVVDGYGICEIAAVGDRTEIGKTLRDSIEETEEKSPLNRQLADLSKVIGVVGFGVAVLTFIALVVRSTLNGTIDLTAGQWLAVGAIGLGVAVALVRVWLPIFFDALELAGSKAEPPGWLEKEGALPWLWALLAGGLLFAVAIGIGIGSGQVARDPGAWLPRAAGQEFLRDFMIAVTIIVVAVPEGLAMSVTLSLAYSMRKMTASNNLVRRMDACETIGAATVICSDKTGTLTLNEMRVFEGAVGGVAATGLPTDPAAKALIVEAIAANTTAHLTREPGEPAKPVGNPTEGSLLLWLDANGADYLAARQAFPVKTQWTFTTERKFMATLGPRLHIKGAPEIVLERSSTRHGGGSLTATDRDQLLAELKGYQARGMRTLGFAYHPNPVEATHDTPVEDVATGLTWLGFVAIADPVRAEVPPAVAAVRRAGVGVKIITGDNSDTAREIARQIGLSSSSKLPAGNIDDEDSGPRAYLTGAEFAAMSDADAARAVNEVRVLSRARPADKLRMVSLLKEQGHVVAVTGDGVNDGPALNHADVGLAMGKTGTAVAKEASDIILLDDSFTSIVSAIRWGRSLYENIQRFILFQLTINVAALGIALLGPFIGFELPLTVMQMLWVNLIMDTFAALALATEPPHDSVLDRKPRRADAFIVTRPMAVSIFVTAGIFLVLLVGLILFLKWTGYLDSMNDLWGGTVIFNVFVLLQFWNLFNAKCLGRNESVFRGLLNNPSFLLVAGAILAGQVLIVQFGGSVFRTQPLEWFDWAWMLGATSVVLVVGELLRFINRLASRKKG